MRYHATHSLEPLFELQGAQAGITLLVLSSPPFDLGRTWSIVKLSSEIGGLPQYAQRLAQASLIDCLHWALASRLVKADMLNK